MTKRHVEKIEKRRGRELGLPFPGTPGPLNAITDVSGVKVGYSTIIKGEGEVVTGKGPVRTGVTAILPRGHSQSPTPVWAGFHALNGNGEMTGTHWIHDAGYFQGPMVITNTHSVGIAHHATVKWMINNYTDAHLEHHMWALPVIAETYDGGLNDINGQHVKERHVFEAINSATGGAIAEGNVGGGTGMVCYEFKGGTGTSSRVARVGRKKYTVGALVQANHGSRSWLSVLGVPVGMHLTEDAVRGGDQGSIIVVLATDAPMMPYQLTRIAKRASIGIGRNGTPGGNSSGDIFIAFSIANETPNHQRAPVQMKMSFINDEYFDSLYLASVEAVEEAVVNAMLAAEDMTTVRPAGRVCRAIDADELMALMRRYNRVTPGH